MKGLRAEQSEPWVPQLAGSEVPCKGSPVYKQQRASPIRDVWVPYEHCDSGQVN